nr:sensor domain-containing protein [Mycobacterium mantenii]
MDKRVAMERVATHDDMREFTTNDAKDSAGKKSNDSGSVRTATSTPRQVAPTALQANRARIPRPKPVIAVAIGVLAALALGYILVVTGHTPRDPGSTHPVDVPPSADPEITFDGMRDFVAAYYADLPGHPDNAWAKLDTHCKDQTGYADFQKFWASIQSVTIVSVRPRDATSVVAQLNYVRRDGTSDSESRWLKVTPVNGAVLLDESGRIGSTNESPPPAPATRAPSTGSPGFSASSIDSVLPSPMEVSRVVRAGNLQIKSTQGMSDNSGLVTPFFCVGLIFGADRTVYSKSGFDAIIDQTLAASTSAPYTAAGPTEVEQTVVVFPTAQQAQAILASSQRQWQSCATGIVHYRVPNTNGEVGWGFNVGAVQLNDDILTASMAGINRESGDSACQQALGIRANVLVGARTCLMPDIPTSATVADPALAGNYAHLLVAEILSRIHD